MKKQCYEIGYRLKNAQKEQLRTKGYHTYATRSWDTGSGCTLEKFVIVNHIGDVITNFPVEEIENGDQINDFFEYLDNNNVEYNGRELYNDIKEIIEAY